jgi:hypothetical protein
MQLGNIGYLISNAKASAVAGPRIGYGGTGKCQMNVK